MGKNPELEVYFECPDCRGTGLLDGEQVQHDQQDEDDINSFTAEHYDQIPESWDCKKDYMCDRCEGTGELEEDEIDEDDRPDFGRDYE